MLCFIIEQTTTGSAVVGLLQRNQPFVEFLGWSHRVCVRRLYSLLWLESDEDQDTRAAILEPNTRIETNVEKSMFTKDGNSSKKRARTGDTTRGSSRAGEGGGDGRARLRAHGYEVNSDVIADASGDE